jgi:hypothetical protein
LAHVFGVPVLRILLDADHLARFPLGQGERAVADEVARAGPFRAALVEGAELLQRGLVDRVPAGQVDHGEEIGGRGSEAHLQGAVVEGLDAHLSEVLDGSLVIGLAVLQAEEQVGVAAGEVGSEGAVPAGDEVARDDGVAVGPLGVGAQVEGDGQLVGRDLPGGGDGGNGLHGPGVEVDEAFEQGARDVELRGAGDNLRVEFLRLGAVAHKQDPLARGAVRRRLLLATDRVEKGSQNGHQNDRCLRHFYHGFAPYCLSDRWNCFCHDTLCSCFEYTWRSWRWKNNNHNEPQRGKDAKESL